MFNIFVVYYIMLIYNINRYKILFLIKIAIDSEGVEHLY